MKYSLSLFLLVAYVALSACGNKGDLYLPEAAIEASANNKQETSSTNDKDKK